MTMPSILEKIVSRKQQEVALLRQQHSIQQWRILAEKTTPPRPFINTIAQQMQCGKPAVIAEIKKASPSKGLIRQDFDARTIAIEYQQAGASCLSVLTDRDFFQGNNSYLQQARQACQLPVLRKDFIIDELQIFEARCIDADAILLIVAALGDQQLQQLYTCAKDCGMEVLVEVHNKQELERALAIDSELIGINNRNLHDFSVDLQITETLLQYIPEQTTVITESGIHSRADVQRMRDQGVDGFLVGESLMRQPSPGEKLRALFF